MKTHVKKFPTFWTGETARQLAGSGPFTKLVADYFFTSPAAIAGDNYGIYYIERGVMQKHLEIDDAALDQAVDLLARLMVAFWDARTEWVFVREMAAWQYGTPLLPRDYNCTNARRFYRHLPKNPWLASWFDRYVSDLCLQQDQSDEKQWVDRREWTGPAPALSVYLPVYSAPPPKPRAGPAPAPEPPKPLERALQRLTSLRMNGAIGGAVATAIKQLRQGDVQASAIERQLLDVVIAELGDQVTHEAREVVQPFKARMAADEYTQAYQRALDAAARKIANLPVFFE